MGGPDVAAGGGRVPLGASGDDAAPSQSPDTEEVVPVRLPARTRIIALGSLVVGFMAVGPCAAPSLAVDKPDLVVTVSDPPASAFPGDTFALDVTVENKGLGAANATSSLTQITTKFYLVAGNT